MVTPIDPRSLTSSADGIRQVWTIVEGAWAATVERARGLTEPRLHESVDGEWSFVETLRHLVFATDAWVRRGILGEARAYHRLGMPPDHRIGQPEAGVDVSPWGINVHVRASLDEVLDVRADRMATVRRVVEDLGPADLQRLCPPNAAPGFPPTAGLQVGHCLEVVVGEEWAHHGYATRDLAVLEGR